MGLERRIKEWEREYEKEGKVIIKWRKLSTHETKSSAQAAETKEAEAQNCIAHPGGRGRENAKWYMSIN